ncbi:stress response protein nst1 [Rhizophagus clarus]|uniref:Stress response protein NST1 n=1 Tax=Rhizophagus clarus TaxID=94130 RepID=A0A8H3L4I5_9GLOM|nr:stress response protein nst1 [Rhizophagus clarus]
MMATSHTFPPEESLPHPPPNFQPQQINTKQAVIYNKSGTKCMNIVKDPSGMPLSPTSPSTRDQNDVSPSHNPQNNNMTTKKKKKRKGKRKSTVDHVEETEIQVNGTHNNHIKANFNSENEEEALDVDLEEEDEFFSDDDGYDPEAPEIPFPRKDSIANHDGDNNHAPTTPSKKKKKKKKNKNGLSMNQISDIHHNHPHHNHNHKSRKDGIWNTNNNEERQRIREFWLQLGEEERRSLVKVEKEAVLKKMKEQQKHSCSCSVCGKKRTAIEAELETLYDAYYEELESYANHQQQFGSSNIEYRNDAEFDDDDDDEEYEDDEDEDDEDYEGSEHDSDTRKEFFNNFGNSLTVKGGILTVADDLLKNDGKKFLEMMERLAERRMQREEEESAMDRGEYYDEDEDEDEDEYEEDGEEDNQTEEQRMEEGRRMFQIFAARMFEQRVLNAYREKVAQERQQKLLEELEEENRLKEERELKKLKEKEKKKAKNRALKQQKEEERARREAERLAEEKAQRAEREKKLEEERKRREEERLKKEAERRQREEERQRKEEEKRRKAREEKEKEERRKKEQEARERKEKEKEEKERKEREEKARKEKEERRQREERERKQRELKEKERKEREEHERKEREKKEREAKERERKEKEEQERKEREEKERKEREEKQKVASANTLRQQQHERKRTITPIGQPSAQPPPPPSISTPVIQNKPVVSMPNGMNWINYSSHEQHQPLPHHLPPPPNHSNHPPPHPLFNPGGPQPQFGGQPVGIMNGPAGMTNEVANEVFTNTKKAINPPPQGTNTLQGINPTSSLFATGLGPIGMGVHPHHGGPPVPIHAHQVMRQQMPPPRGFNPIAPTPHLPGPSGVPPSVASTNLSLLNEAAVMSGNGNIGAGVTGNPQNGAFGGLPIVGGQGPLGPQTFNLGSQVPTSSHIGPNVVPNTPLAPIGHRRMSQHPEDSHVKAVQRPQPIQRPRKNSGTGQSLEIRTRSPPPGFGNMVGSGVLLGDDKTNSMTNRRQSLAAGESSYFSNSLFSTAVPGESNPPPLSPSQNQQQHGTNRVTHRPVVGDNEWPPIRGRQSVTDNLLGESASIGSNNNGSNNIGTNDIWASNFAGGQSLWYSEVLDLT